MDIDVIGFVPALLPVALSPGASFTLVMSSALAGGRSGLLRTLAGTAVGIYIHALLIGLGLTAIIISLPGVYNLLEMAGTVYLLWLGLMLIRSGVNAQRDNTLCRTRSISVGEALMVNLLNPKAIVFYLTVVSRFAGQHGGVGNYLILASLHVVVMGLWLCIVSHILIFSAKGRNPQRLKKYVNISGGGLLIVFTLFTLAKRFLNQQG
ncbi:LysE family translocator [Pantoea allii]|uniref:LysE family translocator n=1 Tax=Pantoea allii TaxID=574096 RepID=A0ABS6VCF2_9GAMM|nr:MULTISPECIES: LysE family translocator [Pantoea]MBW1213769.1 LysE family translocator [Pantoea allii]MBW1251840.1 LysE family translocator [Pantoea allii]MBW1256988.1 LysE family translocator [Pantoea allii]MBW1260437.1 LysE family translocator [Pantoea allii]MBW1266065.1 LysE family translocator [Pantoea allii]